jgi:hypothetical protein
MRLGSPDGIMPVVATPSSSTRRVGKEGECDVAGDCHVCRRHAHRLLA